MTIMSEIIERIHPGEIVRKSIEALNMSSKEFSYRTGISERTISDLINKKGSITFDIAEKLSEFFGNNLLFWMNLQTQYTMYLSQLKYKEEIEEDYKCIRPVLGYLKTILSIENNDSKETIVKKVRSTIKINKLTLLNEAHSFASLKELHGCYEDHLFERNLWLSLSLTLARQNNVSDYNKNKLLSYIDEIRNMTVQNPEKFSVRLNEILAECGVSFVLMPYLPRSNIYGATKWLTTNRVMLSLSNRSGRADSFWFTLFHELAHVTFEHKRYMLFSCENLDDKEADEFAKNILIPKKDWDAFVYRDDFSEQAIRRFASEINILPQIVLGRLEKENRVKYGLLDKKFMVTYAINF